MMGSIKTELKLPLTPMQRAKFSPPRGCAFHTLGVVSKPVRHVVLVLILTPNYHHVPPGPDPLSLMGGL